MASERYAKFLKMTLGDLDILAAASQELLTTTLANMPESTTLQKGQAIVRELGAKKRERLEQKIRGRLDVLRQAPSED